MLESIAPWGWAVIIVCGFAAIIILVLIVAYHMTVTLAPDGRGKQQRQRTRVEISSYPLVRMTLSQFTMIQTREVELRQSLEDKFLLECPIGTYFVCKSDPTEPTVIGHIVKGDDAICNQYGAGEAVPDRFVNRYRLEIVGDEVVTSIEI